MRRIIRVTVAIILLGTLCLFSDRRALSQSPALTPIISSGLSSPVYITDAGDGTSRLFIVEQGGTIKVYKNDQLLATPFLDISSKVTASGERGLLGLAFHPNFENNRKFYVYYTDTNGDITLAEYKATTTTSDVASPTSARRIMRIGHSTNSNHNGGCIQFGRDGFLYIGTGDGGGAGDPLGNGQNRKTLLGKILRIDINSGRYRIPPTNPFRTSKVARREIWAYGLRNPWRFSFDPATGRLFAADVGQGEVEEVDIIKRGKNYGWNTLEGSQCYSPSTGCSSRGTILPISEYHHDEGESITGGYLYRGNGVPALQGKYIFGDFISGTIWTLTRNTDSTWTRAVLFSTGLSISSFGRDRDGEVYVVDYTGTIYRITQQ